MVRQNHHHVQHGFSISYWNCLYTENTGFNSSNDLSPHFAYWSNYAGYNESFYDPFLSSFLQSSDPSHDSVLLILQFISVNFWEFLQHHYVHFSVEGDFYWLGSVCAIDYLSFRRRIIGIRIQCRGCRIMGILKLTISWRCSLRGGLSFT